MSLIEAFVLALALCVDSLVVSTTTAFREKISYRRGVAMALVFGLCQGAFPLMGALVGDVARAFIEAVDHWVSFGLLAFVGGRMVIEGIRGKEEEASQRPLNVGTMFLLGIATSIDAFAVGIGLGLEHQITTVLLVVVIIAAVTAVVSLLGVCLGKRNIPVPERTATIIAGVVLVGLGAKILLEHLMA